MDIDWENIDWEEMDLEDMDWEDFEELFSGEGKPEKDGDKPAPEGEEAE